MAKKHIRRRTVCGDTRLKTLREHREQDEAKQRPKKMVPKPKKVSEVKVAARRLQKAINEMRKQLSKMERKLRKIK